ncbi:hypothetical protein [Yoonia sp. 2307UL14-13]|uniref:hypothetical protein n=1 Tax=Yoonia sp. 2307UL14-13 TaxID=3126506 RepID=UPI0030EB4323
MIWKSVKFLKAFGVLTVLTFPIGAVSQTDEAGIQAPSPCTTNIGPNGELFTGYFGLVSVPTGVHTVETSDDTIYADPLYTFGNSIIVFPKDGIKNGSAELRFFDENRAEIYACVVTPEVHNFDRDGVEGLMFGVCPELRRPQPMAPVQINVFDSIRQIGNFFVNDPQIADGSILEGSSFFIQTKSVGIAQFVFFEDRDFLGNQRNTPRREKRWAAMASCPIQIAALDDPLVGPDAPTCLFENGEPARAQAGQTVTLRWPLEASAGLRYVGKGAIFSRDIDLNHDRERRTTDVLARVAGTYDFLFRSETGYQDEICMLAVDP